MSHTWAKGSTRRWRQLRASILAANQTEHAGACQLNITNVCTGQAECVHHVLGKAVTGDDPKHLIASCSACNAKVGSPTRWSPPHRPITRW